MTKQEYLEKALKYFKANYPEEEPQANKEDFSIIIKDRSRIILDTPYLMAAKNDYIGWEKILKIFFENSRAIFQETQNINSWNEVVNKIFPQLKTINQLSYVSNLSKDFHAEKEDLVISDDFLGEIKTTWVIDSPKGYIYITGKMLEKYKKPIADLKPIALNNLINLSGTQAGPRLTKMKDGGVSVIWAVNDGYDAARLLLPDFYNIIRNYLGDTFFVGIPHRDVLIATSINYQSSLAAFIIKEFSQSSHPICNKLIRASLQGFSILNNGN